MKLKKFKTWDEQIELLKSRNLIIKNKSKLKLYLQKYNYQNFINAYNDPFMLNFDRNTNKYRDDVDSEHIINLFNFDRTISSYIFKYLQNIERELSSIITYIIGEEMNKIGYKSCLVLDFNKYDYKKIFTYNKNEIKYLKKQIENLINKRDDILFKKYYQNQKINLKKIPIWVLSLSWDFGTLINIYKKLNKNIKYKILNYFSRTLEFNISSFENVVFMFKKFRNRIAHNNVIYNYVYKSNLNDMQYFLRKNNIKANNINIGVLIDIIDKFNNNTKLSKFVKRVYINKIVKSSSFISETSKEYIKKCFNFD